MKIEQGSSKSLPGSKPRQFAPEAMPLTILQPCPVLVTSTVKTKRWPHPSLSGRSPEGRTTPALLFGGAWALNMFQFTHKAASAPGSATWACGNHVWHQIESSEQAGLMEKDFLEKMVSGWFCKTEVIWERCRVHSTGEEWRPLCTCLQRAWTVIGQVPWAAERRLWPL